MAATDDHRSVPVAELGLSLRTRSGLSAAGIGTTGQVAAMSQLELLDIGQLNGGSLDEIKVRLSALGLRLRDDSGA